MKRIYMVLALLGTMATGAYAQKNLKATFVKPTASQTFTNTPDSMYYQFSITNVGPDTVDATKGDTLSIMLDIQYFGCVLQNIKWLKYDVGTTILPGQSRTFNFTTENNGQFWNDATAPKVTVTPDSKWCPKVGVFGVSTTDEGSFFFAGNPGVDVDVINAAFTNATTQAELGDMIMPGLSGDALGVVTGVTFGTGANNKCVLGILDLNGDTKESLKIYPNPASDNLNFDLSLEKSSIATVKVMDIAGRVVLTQELGKVAAGEHKFSTNVSNLNAGTYIIEVSSEGKRSVSKFNKN
jgi:hypothetical protein